MFSFPTSMAIADFNDDLQLDIAVVYAGRSSNFKNDTSLNIVVTYFWTNAIRILLGLG